MLEELTRRSMGCHVGPMERPSFLVASWRPTGARRPFCIKILPRDRIDLKPSIQVLEVEEAAAN
jgi:hypothetical protein